MNQSSEWTSERVSDWNVLNLVRQTLKIRVYFKKILLNISNKKQTFEAPKPPFYRSIGTSGLEWTWMNILGLPSKMNGL